MKDTIVSPEAIEAFKGTVFMWEVIITVIVFTGIWFILQRYKKNADNAKTKNQDYERL